MHYGCKYTPDFYDIRRGVFIEVAATRMEAGFTPMAMLWKDEQGRTDREWRRFQRTWARPALIHGMEGV